MQNDLLNPAPAQRDIWTVNRLNLEVQGMLEGSFPLLWIEGEISNLSRPSSGHLYFSLKDSRAQVSAAMFKGRNARLRFEPRNGLQVLVRARVTLYAPRGSYQLVVEHMEDAGEGRLRREFEELKAKLDAEGLFSSERKRPLPSHPKQIGVITSASGAALRDILHVLQRRSPQLPVLIYPSAVQGKEAPAQLRAALQRAISRDECDVLVLARGGGSLEDLWAFNDEQLARDIAASPIPTVSAVGHEIDFTLADFVADVRAPTPSAAAELVSPDTSAVRDALTAKEKRLTQLLNSALQQRQEKLQWLSKRLPSPLRALERATQQIDELDARLARQVQGKIREAQQHLTQLSKRLVARDPRQQVLLAKLRLDGLSRRLTLPLPRTLKENQKRITRLGQRLHVASPLATLERGYSVSLIDVDIAGKTEVRAAKSVADIHTGQTVTTHLADGTFEAKIEKITATHQPKNDAPK